MQTILDFVSANIVAITAIQQGLFTALSLGLQLAGLTRASKVFGTFTSVDLGRIVRWISINMAVSKAMKGGMVSIAVLLLGGCGGTIHTQIEKALVFEQQVHTYQQQLQGIAEAAIVMLPPETQPAARAKLMDATAKLTLALDAKDAALQAALDASDTANLNVNQLVADIVAAVNAVVTLVNSFGADRNHTDFVGRSLVAAQVRAVR